MAEENTKNMQEKKQKIILDCDPGLDDAVAIMLATKNPQIELLGITTICGNQGLEKTTQNAIDTLNWIGVDMPVYPGCEEPLVREKLFAGEIHGDSGMGDFVFPEYDQNPESKHACIFIIDTIMNSPDKITFVTTGPMTNLAVALRLQPKIKDKIKRIVMMGGAFNKGNVTAAAEFNVFADAEAAKICFECGLPVLMIGWDVTSNVNCFPHVMDRMRKVNNKASELFCALMDFYNAMQKEKRGLDGAALNDPITIAAIMEPKLLKTEAMYVDVDTGMSSSYGRTNCDYYHNTNNAPNAEVAISADVDLFWDIIEASLRRHT